MRVVTLEEHTRAVILVDRPEAGLRAGDVGVVVHIHPEGGAYFLEFFTGDGETLAVEFFEADEVAAPSRDQILHVRSLSAA